MSNIYYEILDFVTKVKKLEYCILNKYNYHGESVFRGVWDKVIPRKGEVKFQLETYAFFFHGSGVEFICEGEKLQYDRGFEKGLGVHFTPLIHNRYRENQSKIDKEYERLLTANLIAQWMPEIPGSKVFYLK